MAQPWGVCARCGFKRRLNHLCKEWTGNRVCRDTCWDPRPPDLRPPRYGPEGLPRPDAAPEPAPIFKEDYAIRDGEDL
jgi:hypothetical protein